MPGRRPPRTLTPGAEQRRGSHRPGSRGRGDDLGGEQVEGRQAVRELLAAGRRETFEVLLSADAGRSPIMEEIVALAAAAAVPLTRCSPEEIERSAASEVPQGVIARAAPIEATPLERLVARSGAGAPFLVVLDGVTDPHNLGAVMRSALGAGVTGIVLPRHRAARISATVAKAAAGAVEHLPVALVSGVPSALRYLAEQGVWSVGLDSEGSRDIDDVEILEAPVALVFGAEGAGLGPLSRDRCDVMARIPLLGPLDSLNVAAAAAVACFTVARRRERARKDAPERPDAR